jgi:hypothetical protein
MIEQKQNNWMLDKHIPVGLVLAIILQTALGLVWAGQLVQRVEFIEQRTEFIDSTSERIARLEETTNYMRRSLERLEHKLDKWKENEKWR